MDWQKCFCILTLTRCTLLHSHNKVISIHETGCVLTKNENFTEVGAASPGGRETKALGLY